MSDVKGWKLLQGMFEELYNAPEGSVVLLHVCAHNFRGCVVSVVSKHTSLMVLRTMGFIQSFQTLDRLSRPS